MAIFQNTPEKSGTPVQGLSSNGSTSSATSQGLSSYEFAEDERHRRHEANRGKKCFVIMPFGTKTHPFTGEKIDFDQIYAEVISVALGDILEDFERSDSATAAGLIHTEMIDDIISADVAVVDITTANPNVMYELGVRHAAKRSGTVVVKKMGDKIPFNIGGIRAFEYPDSSDHEAMESFIDILSTSVQNALDGGQVDSLVHGLFRDLNVTRRARPIHRREAHIYRWPSEVRSEDARELCIITGDIADVLDVDVWVNPENTAMQMGRFYDNSTSATIRYFGAERNKHGYVVRDNVSQMLRQSMRRGHIVEPGTVLVTNAGRLERSNGVKKILHVAAQYGEPSKGYVTVRNVAGCVSNCLNAIDQMNDGFSSWIFNRADYETVMLPLFGTRNSNGLPEQTARDLVEAAVLYFEKFSKSRIRRVYFSAYTDVDLALCEQAFKYANLVKIGSEPESRLRHRHCGRRDRWRRWKEKKRGKIDAGENTLH